MSEWYIIVFLMNNREKLYNITQGIVVQWILCSFEEQKKLDTFGGQARYFRIRFNFSLTRNAINTFCNKPILVDLITSEKWDAVDEGTHSECSSIVLVWFYFTRRDLYIYDIYEDIAFIKICAEFGWYKRRSYSEESWLDQCVIYARFTNLDGSKKLK